MKQLPRFYIGTTNPHKIREIASILRPLEIDLEVTDPIDPDETGETFEANALIKAEAYSKHVRESLLAEMVKGADSSEMVLAHLRLSRVWTICEDSGLVVPALNDLPGPWSARFADCQFQNGKIVGHQLSARKREEIDLANNRLVLELMKDIDQPRRVAAFIVCFVIADITGKAIFQTTARVTGWILPEMRGDKGFGYDPIFAGDKSFGKSYAEIDSMRKNLFSHRRKALQQFTAWLAGQIR
jgi:XTP/dITP diphosphohydrolase